MNVASKCNSRIWNSLHCPNACHNGAKLRQIQVQRGCDARVNSSRLWSSNDSVFSLRQKLNELKQRTFDLILIAELVFLSAIGYHSVRQHTLQIAVYPCLLAPLLLSSFIGVFFPFRWLTRFLWLVLSPPAIWFAILFGQTLYTRLNFAPGIEQNFYFFLCRVLPCTVYVYLLPIPIWMMIYLLGWRLRIHDHEVTTRSVQLKELFALTGVFGLASLLAKQSVSIDQFEIGKDILFDNYHALVVTAAIESLFLIPVVLATFSRSHFFALMACMLYFGASVTADRIYRFQDDATAFRDFLRAWPTAYVALPFRGFRFLGCIAFMTLVLLYRLRGFRLHHHSPATRPRLLSTENTPAKFH